MNTRQIIDWHVIIRPWCSLWPYCSDVCKLVKSVECLASIHLLTWLLRLWNWAHIMWQMVFKTIVHNWNHPNYIVFLRLEVQDSSYFIPILDLLELQWWFCFLILNMIKKYLLKFQVCVFCYFWLRDVEQKFAYQLAEDFVEHWATCQTPELTLWRSKLPQLPC